MQVTSAQGSSGFEACRAEKPCVMVGCVRAPQINCLEGSTFMVSDVVGDAGPDPDEVLGLFYRDMRHLSCWQLTIDGERLDPLSNGASGYPSATFFLAGPGSTVYQNPTLSVIRERTLGQGSGEDLHEKLTVINSGREGRWSSSCR